MGFVEGNLNNENFGFFVIIELSFSVFVFYLFMITSVYVVLYLPFLLCRDPMEF